MNSQFGVFKSSFFYTEILSETGEKIAKNGPPNRLELNSLPEPTKATFCQNRLAEPTQTDPPDPHRFVAPIACFLSQGR